MIYINFQLFVENFDDCLNLLTGYNCLLKLLTNYYKNLLILIIWSFYYKFYYINFRFIKEILIFHCTSYTEFCTAK